ncbi:MAG: NYN domain-containing protein, partial [Clostridia bacterium]|nr:NYN domain-containing protein [Clostridia bacterium]
YIIETVKIRGDILLGKVYGYTERYTQLKECLLSNTFSVVPSIRYGKAQKNNLDIQLVIDALEVAYVNSLINCFCIVSGDSDYTPLVGKLKSMGKRVLGISRSEVASGIFIKACSEFIFLESVAVKKQAPKPTNKEKEAPSDIQELITLTETILSDQDEDMMYASELKDTLTRLRPDFNERSYGFATFGKLLGQLCEKSSQLKLWSENSALKIGLSSSDSPKPQMTKTNWLEAFKVQLDQFKQDGFERINPSILKSAIQAEYPDFEERQIGFKRFSDVMKRLEKEGLLKVEMDEAHTMLLKIC